MLIEKNDGDHFRVFFVVPWGYSFELYSKLLSGLGLFLRETVREDCTVPAEGVYNDASCFASALLVYGLLIFMPFSRSGLPEGSAEGRTC